MKKYLKNSSFGVFQLIFSIVIVFFSIPIFIHTYGLKLYGVFSIISIFGNLTLLFNLGLNTALLKFITEDNREEVRNAHVSVSLIILGSITLFFSLLFLLTQNYIVGDFFKIDTVIRPNLILSFRMFILANLFIMLGQPFVALIQADNDFYLTSTIQWIYNLINGIGIIILSKLNAPFSFIALPALASAIIWFLLLFYFCWFKYNYKIFRFFKEFSFIDLARKQLRYSIQVYLISLLSFFNEPLLKILVARFLGAQAVGSFDIILRIKGQLIGLFTKIFEPLSAIIASKKEPSAIRYIVHFSEQIAFIVFIPLTLIVYFSSGFLLKFWLKDLSETFATGIKMSVIIFTLSMIVVPNYYYLIFHGKMRQCITIQISGILVSLISLFAGIFIFKNQILSPVISICLGIVTAFLINIFYQWKYLQSVIFDFSSLFPLIVLIVLTILFIIAVVFKLVLFQFIIILLSLYAAGLFVYKLNRKGVLNFFN